MATPLSTSSEEQKLFNELSDLEERKRKHLSLSQLEVERIENLKRKHTKAINDHKLLEKLKSENKAFQDNFVYSLLFRPRKHHAIKFAWFVLMVLFIVMLWNIIEYVKSLVKKTQDYFAPEPTTPEKITSGLGVVAGFFGTTPSIVAFVVYGVFLVTYTTLYVSNEVPEFFLLFMKAFVIVSGFVAAIIPFVSGGPLWTKLFGIGIGIICIIMVVQTIELILGTPRRIATFAKDSAYTFKEWSRTRYEETRDYISEILKGEKETRLTNEVPDNDPAVIKQVGKKDNGWGFRGLSIR